MLQVDPAARADAENVYARYALGIDAADFDMVATCFSPDVVFEVRDLYRVEGRESVINRIRSRHRAGRTHITTNVLIEQPDSAVLRGRATFLVLAGDGTAEACGEYRDTLARDQHDTWTFTHRHISYRATWGHAKESGS